MTKDEALSSSIAAVQMATKLLEKGNLELSYSWSVIADTWASIAKAIDSEPEDPDWEPMLTRGLDGSQAN